MDVVVARHGHAHITGLHQLLGAAFVPVLAPAGERPLRNHDGGGPPHLEPGTQRGGSGLPGDIPLNVADALVDAICHPGMGNGVRQHTYHKQQPSQHDLVTQGQIAPIALVEGQCDKGQADPPSPAAGEQRAHETEERPDYQERKPAPRLALTYGPAQATQAENTEQHAGVAELDHLGVTIGTGHAEHQLLPGGKAAGTNRRQGSTQPDSRHPRRIGQKQQEYGSGQEEADGLVQATAALPIPPDFQYPEAAVEHKDTHDRPVPPLEHEAWASDEKDRARQQKQRRADGVATREEKRDRPEEDDSEAGVENERSR